MLALEGVGLDGCNFRGAVLWTCMEAFLLAATGKLPGMLEFLDCAAAGARVLITLLGFSVIVIPVPILPASQLIALEAAALAMLLLALLP